MPPFVIVGMHRSGTSLVASLLQSANVDVGKRLVEGDWSNPRGHYEDVDFVAFHRATLTDLHLHPDGWTTEKIEALPETWHERAGALLEQKRTASGAWGWKDPRTALFLDHWAPLIPDATYVFVYRAPWEVVDSLYRRGDRAFDADPSLAMRCWLFYNRMMLEHQQASERVLLANLTTIARWPAEWVTAVAARSGQRLGQANVSRFDPTLLHTAVKHRRTELVCELFPEALDLYAALEERAWRPSGYEQPLAKHEAPPWVRPKRSFTPKELRLIQDNSRAAIGEASKPSLSPYVAQERCAICGAVGPMSVQGKGSVREVSQCIRCGADHKHRLQAGAVLATFGGGTFGDFERFVNSSVARELSVYEIGIRGPLAQRLSRLPHYRNSHYWHDVQPGAYRGGVQCQDVHQLTFPDQSFDLVLSQDVMEHVTDVQQALREIHRVLKPGGAYIFTAKAAWPWPDQTVNRTRVGPNGLEHLTEPKYYPSPVGPPCLLHRDLGADIVPLLRDIGFRPLVFREYAVFPHISTLSLIALRT